jgi:hypothetical protein
MGIRKWHTVARGRKEWRRIKWGSQGPQWNVALEEEEEEEKKKNFMKQFPNQECSCPLLETSFRPRIPIYILRPHF